MTSRDLKGAVRQYGRLS